MMNQLWVKVLVVVVFAACGYFYGLSHKVTEKHGGLKMPMIFMITAVAGCAGWFLLGLEGVVWQATIVAGLMMLSALLDKRLWEISFAVVSLTLTKILFGIAARHFIHNTAIWLIVVGAVIFAINFIVVFKASLCDDCENYDENK